MMDKYVYHSIAEDIDSIEDSEKNFSKYNTSGIIKGLNKEDFKTEFISNAAFSESKNSDNIFYSEEKQGTIGEFSDDESDNISDNFFYD
ncbi:hypothetical protein [Chryseobacterium sp. POE27]|uniref:hypothetical protein n=1 Tax=Chryseobacterium sp. POE27 TaxID=3138177 RepID=UPI003219373F